MTLDAKSMYWIMGGGLFVVILIAYQRVQQWRLGKSATPLDPRRTTG